MLPISTFLEDKNRTSIHRVSGSAIYLNGNPDFTPIALLHNIKHNKVLHEKNCITTIEIVNVPHVLMNQRLHFKELAGGFYKVIIRYGFMEDPDVPRELKRLGVCADPNAATYILSCNTLVASRSPGMALWRERIFSFLTVNSYMQPNFSIASQTV
jgi:KUP system potassium uptake protein